jgi:hypothetical protein
MSKGLGPVLTLIRFFLLVINILVVLLGLLVFILAAVLKWGSGLKDIVDVPGFDKIFDIAAIGTVGTALLILGAFCVVVGAFGFIGVKSLNRFFLFIYEIVLLVLFLGHAIALLYLVFNTSSIENLFRDEMKKTVEIINKGNTTDGYKERCDLMNGLSTLFSCCGNTSPGDLTIRQACCNVDYTNSTGCSNKVIDDIKNQSVYYLVIPSSVILFIELVGLIMVVFLWKKKQD